MLSTKQLQQPNNQLGVRGEQLAQSFLLKQKYRIVGSNVAWKRLEVDIVAITPDNSTLVFVEVKTKSTSRFGFANQAYTYKKRYSYERIGKIISARLGWKKAIRFDIIAIIMHPFSLDHYQYVNST